MCGKYAKQASLIGIEVGKERRRELSWTSESFEYLRS